MDDVEEEGWGRTPPEQVRVRAALCRTAAQQLLKRCEVNGPPVPVEKVARQLGFDVRVVVLPRGVDARLRLSGASRLIELASGQARVRHRFSIAHELGHHSLGHRHGKSDLAEQEANSFASALLAPQSWLKHDIDDFPSAVALAERYAVSRDVIFIAAQRARLLDRLR